MSHNLVGNELALGAIRTGTDIPYVGFMNPLKRCEAIREDLTESG